MTTKRSWRARKIDAVTNDIASFAESVGFIVHRTNADWDLTVQLYGMTSLWECKTGKGRITEKQEKLKQAGWNIRTVRTTDDVLAARNDFLAVAALGA